MALGLPHQRSAQHFKKNHWVNFVRHQTPGLFFPTDIIRSTRLTLLPALPPRGSSGRPLLLQLDVRNEQVLEANGMELTWSLMEFLLCHLLVHLPSQVF